MFRPFGISNSFRFFRLLSPSSLFHLYSSYRIGPNSWASFNGVGSVSVRLKVEGKEPRIDTLHYVTVRNKVTGELLSAWPYRSRRGANEKFKETEAAEYRSEEAVVIDIETINATVQAYPPQTKKIKPKN
jgi:hypothetical protein